MTILDGDDDDDDDDDDEKWNLCTSELLHLRLFTDDPAWFETGVRRDLVDGELSSVDNAGDFDEDRTLLPWRFICGVTLLEFSWLFTSWPDDWVTPDEPKGKDF